MNPKNSGVIRDGSPNQNSSHTTLPESPPAVQVNNGLDRTRKLTVTSHMRGKNDN